MRGLWSSGGSKHQTERNIKLQFDSYTHAAMQGFELKYIIQMEFFEGQPQNPHAFPKNAQGLLHLENFGNTSYIYIYICVY